MCSSSSPQIFFLCLTEVCPAAAGECTQSCINSKSRWRHLNAYVYKNNTASSQTLKFVGAKKKIVFKKSSSLSFGSSLQGSSQPITWAYLTLSILHDYIVYTHSLTQTVLVIGFADVSAATPVGTQRFFRKYLIFETVKEKNQKTLKLSGNLYSESYRHIFIHVFYHNNLYV